MDPRTPLRTLYISLFAVAAGILLYFGLRNRPDPLWLETAALLRESPCLLYECPDSLRQLYAAAHKEAYQPGDSAAWRWVAWPGMANIEWERFKHLYQTARDQRALVISGVTGAGSTKYARHLARLLAGKPEYLMEINCAPQFDLEYHRKYIGREEETGAFHPGLLVRFWEQCSREPDRRFVLMLDNFDKINPETFFGPELWEALSSRGDTVWISSYPVSVPRNFYLLSATHLGPGSHTEFNAEHFKRLGRQYILEPNVRELLVWLRQKEQRLASKAVLDEKDSSRLAALRDTANLHHFLFAFAKTNQILRNTFGRGYELGQGSNLRQYYSPDDLKAFRQAVFNHVQGMRTEKNLTQLDLHPIEYTIRHGGLEPGSNYLARQINFLQEAGYLVEIIMVGATALLTALLGWWMFRRRERIMRDYGEKVQFIFARFENQETDAETAALELDTIKQEVNQLVMRRRLNYTEALYFLAFIEDKTTRIELASSVSEHFADLFNTFMEDNVLTESEYLKLLQFLESIRHKIPEEIYVRYQDNVQRAYKGGS